MIWYCKFLDLPLIPESVLTDVLCSLTVMRDYKGWAHTKLNEKILSADNPFYHANDKLTKWLDNNILSSYNDVGIRYARFEDGKTTTGIHTDQTRKFVLQYLLESGNGILNFWKESNQPIVRDGRVTLNSYDNLELLETYHLPEKQWVLLNASILHSVENLTSDRISIQISLNYDPFQS